MEFLVIPFVALIPLLAAALAGGGAVAGAAIQRGGSKRDIANQNAYNNPSQQISRLREAGLPFASFQANQAGNQSALPVSNDAGLGAAGVESGKGLSNYITTQAQLKQIEILNAEIKLKNAEARNKEAETDWLLSGAGEDRAGTNLTRNLRTQYQYSEGQASGIQIANKIQSIVAENTPTRLGLENRKLAADIENALKQGGLLDEQTKGANIENKIKSVIASYQERMSNEQFIKLMKENDLLDENIDIAKSEGRIRQVRAFIEENTKYSQWEKIHNEGLLSGLTYDRVSAEFENYNQYMEFVKRAQDAFRAEKITTRGERWKQILAAIYTSLTDRDGSNTLLNHIQSNK